ncbi:MAG TPA: MlaD family protein, partial [Acetobacteraceae bacterium]|nr:MlaD family protein [Acetobacteraceae bacterium]
EVLGYDIHPAERAEDTFINVHLFIRAPYDTFVHEGSYFWNTSGVSVQLGAEGVRLQLESLQAVLSGGIAFDTPAPPRDGPTSPAEAVFPLYDDHSAAISAGFRDRVSFLTYFTGSVRGLAVGAPVELYGIPIGSVTDIQLEFDPSGHNSRVAVRFVVQPERIFGRGTVPNTPPLEVARQMVRSGLRVQPRSANLLTGQMLLAMDFFPDQSAHAASIQEQDGVIVLPSVPGGLEGLTSSVSSILQKLQALPLAEMAQHLDSALAGLDTMTNGPGAKDGLRAVTATLAALQELIRQTSAGIGPALSRMPQISEQMQALLDRASRLLASADAGYGGNSQVRRDLERLMAQFSDAARSVRLLSDYLDQHPEALLRGRSGSAAAP